MSCMPRTVAATGVKANPWCRLSRRRAQGGRYCRAMTAHPGRPAGAPAPRLMEDWDAAEANAVDWMRYLGHPDARRTSAGADKGLDVVAAAAFAQVKAHYNKVGRQQLQNLKGAAWEKPAARLFFFTTSEYSEPAVQYADLVGMALFTFTLDGNVRPRNVIAAALLNTAASAHQPADVPKPAPTADDASPVPGKAVAVRPAVTGPDGQADVGTGTVLMPRPERASGQSAALLAAVFLTAVFGTGFLFAGVAALIAGSRDKSPAFAFGAIGVAGWCWVVAVTRSRWRRHRGRGSDPAARFGRLAARFAAREAAWRRQPKD